MKKLFFREWFVVTCVGSFVLIALSMETFSLRAGSFAWQPSTKKKILVVVSGAVQRPGVYEVEVGTSVKMVLKQAGLSLEADKKSLYLKKRLLSSCQLEVSSKNVKKEKRKKKGIK